MPGMVEVKIRNKIPTSRVPVELSGVSGGNVFGESEYGIDAMDSCKLQNEQNSRGEKNANGLPLAVTALAILENAACPLSVHFPSSICLNGVCQGHRAAAVTCEFVKHLQRLLLLLLLLMMPLQLITIT